MKVSVVTVALWHHCYKFMGDGSFDLKSSTEIVYVRAPPFQTCYISFCQPFALLSAGEYRIVYEE